jgi:hypothetical protein
MLDRIHGSCFNVCVGAIITKARSRVGEDEVRNASIDFAVFSTLNPTTSGKICTRNRRKKKD